MITMRQLEALRHVMDYGTVTEASRMMSLSQPALSQLISNLEHQSGLHLFVREKKRLIPTQEAQLLNHVASDVLVGIRQLEQISQEIRERKYGRLTISSVMMLGREFIPGLLPAFLAKKPDVRVNVGINTRNTVQSLVSGRRIDIGFAFQTKPQPGVDIIKSFRIPLVCVFPKGDTLESKDIIVAKDLRDRAIVSLSDGTKTQKLIEGHFAKEGVEYIPRIGVQQSEMACAVVARGYGVSLVNPFAAMEYLERGNISVRAFKSPLDMEIGIFVPEGQKPSILAEEFLDIAQSELVRFEKHLSEDGILP